MAIPDLQQFSQQPGGGLVTALRGLNALTKENLENKYYAPNIESEINSKNALTQGQNITNKFLPQNLQSEINSRNALTNKANVMTPLEATNQRNINDWYARKAQSDIDTNKALSSYRAMGGGRGVGGVDNQQLTGLKQQVAIENPEWANDSQKIDQAASAYLSGETELPDGTKLKPVSGLMDSRISSIAKHNTTAQGVNQQRFALTTDSLLNKGEEYLPSVSKYSGALGKSKGGIDAVQNSLGYNSPDYKNYIYFTRTFVPTAAGEMMRALGVNASDQQKAIYQKVINPIAWDQDPKGATENYNKMRKMFKETISNTVGKSTARIKSDLNKLSNSDSNEGKLPPPGTRWMIRPDGVQVTVHEERMDEARKLNYKDV